MSNKSCLQTGCLVSLLIVAAALWWTWRALPRLRMEREARLDMTPAQIESIRDIGQWEFLAVSDEELVDTTREGFFTDDHLVRIYYGTLRLGIDMSQLADSAVRRQADTLVITLPPVGLLDEDFIDDGLTRAFHESGRWSAADREALYQKAHRQMKAHALTPENMATARSNAESEMRKLLHAMGFRNVRIMYDE